MIDNIFYNRRSLTGATNYEILDRLTDKMIIMKNGYVDFITLAQFKTVICDYESFIINDYSIFEIRRHLLEYLLNKELNGVQKELIEFDTGTMHINIYNFEGELEFKVFYGDISYDLTTKSVEAKYKPNDKFKYLCVQPVDKLEHKEIETDIGTIVIENVMILALLKVKFLLNIITDDTFSIKTDGAMKSQFSKNRYRRYLGE